MYAFGWEMCPVWRGCVFSSGLHRGSTVNAYVHNVYTTLRMHVVSLHCRTPSITKTQICIHIRPEMRWREKGREGMVRKRRGRVKNRHLR